MASRQASSRSFSRKRIANLHIGPLRLGSFAELLARHGGAVDAVAPGLRSHVNDRISFARRSRIKNLVAPHQAQRKRIHQRIAGVARLELGLAAQVRERQNSFRSPPRR